jgi:hypothetical protein
MTPGSFGTHHGIRQHSMLSAAQIRHRPRSVAGLRCASLFEIAHRWFPRRKRSQAREALTRPAREGCRGLGVVTLRTSRVGVLGRGWRQRQRGLPCTSPFQARIHCRPFLATVTFKSSVATKAVAIFRRPRAWESIWISVKSSRLCGVHSGCAGPEGRHEGACGDAIPVQSRSREHGRCPQLPNGKFANPDGIAFSCQHDLDDSPGNGLGERVVPIDQAKLVQSEVVGRRHADDVVWLNSRIAQKSLGIHGPGLRVHCSIAPPR